MMESSKDSANNPPPPATTSAGSSNNVTPMIGDVVRQSQLSVTTPSTTPIISGSGPLSTPPFGAGLSFQNFNPVQGSSPMDMYYRPNYGHSSPYGLTNYYPQLHQLSQSQPSPGRPGLLHGQFQPMLGDQPRTNWPRSGAPQLPYPPLPPAPQATYMPSGRNDAAIGGNQLGYPTPPQYTPLQNLYSMPNFNFPPPPSPYLPQYGSSASLAPPGLPLLPGLPPGAEPLVPVPPKKPKPKSGPKVIINYTKARSLPASSSSSKVDEVTISDDDIDNEKDTASAPTPTSGFGPTSVAIKTEPDPAEHSQEFEDDEFLLGIEDKLELARERLGPAINRKSPSGEAEQLAENLLENILLKQDEILMWEMRTADTYDSASSPGQTTDGSDTELGDEPPSKQIRLGVGALDFEVKKEELEEEVETEEDVEINVVKDQKLIKEEVIPPPQTDYFGDLFDDPNTLQEELDLFDSGSGKGTEVPGEKSGPGATFVRENEQILKGQDMQSTGDKSPSPSGPEVEESAGSPLLEQGKLAEMMENAHSSPMEQMEEILQLSPDYSSPTPALTELKAPSSPPAFLEGATASEFFTNPNTPGPSLLLSFIKTICPEIGPETGLRTGGPVLGKWKMLICGQPNGISVFERHFLDTLGLKGDTVKVLPMDQVKMWHKLELDFEQDFNDLCFIVYVHDMDVMFNPGLFQENIEWLKNHVSLEERRKKVDVVLSRSSKNQTTNYPPQGELMKLMSGSGIRVQTFFHDQPAYLAERFRYFETKFRSLSRKTALQNYASDGKELKF